MKKSIYLPHSRPKLLLWVATLFTLAACDLINPAEGIPSYIYVEEFQVITDPAREGSNASKITEAWLNVDGNFLGAYTLPALIPILEEGDHVISLNAGIKDNGVSATPEIYPFYRVFEKTVSLSPNEVDTLSPTTGYIDNAQFAFIEDFESENLVFLDDLQGNTVDILSRSGTDRFEGNFSGVIQLQSDTVALVEVASRDRYRELTATSPIVYLEMNYKSDVPVLFGVVGHDGSANGIIQITYDPGFLPKDEWNKIYFNLTNLLFEQNFPEYQITMQAFIPIENGSFTMDQATVRLDNIKLVHF